VKMYGDLVFIFESAADSSVVFRLSDLGFRRRSSTFRLWLHTWVRFCRLAAKELDCQRVGFIFALWVFRQFIFL
jgi:hypothetical protein